jgi:hypothetical protein
MYSTKEIREVFNSATRKVRTGHKGRYVTPEMMERDAVTETIGKVRKGLPSEVVVTPRYKLRKFNRASE